MFIYPLSQGKLLGKDNVGGNEALRVNLLSAWSARHRLGEILIEKSLRKREGRQDHPNTQIYVQCNGNVLHCYLELEGLCWIMSFT